MDSLPDFDDPSFQLKSQAVFVFSREREKEYAGRFIKDATQLAMIHDVIDNAYDLADGETTVDAASVCIENALLQGGGGVWEQAGSWLVKLSSKHSILDPIWSTLATNPKSTIRFRAAAHVVDMSPDARATILPILLSDRSRKVRSKVVGDLWVASCPDAAAALKARLPDEQDKEIASQIEEAIVKCCG
ncbi:hypothetical protein [Allorhodopirellula heiligendammensis]|uniref:HEAT repeat protein n=1 Tax=Allorhodopirellula heiligendammensis TaxID=2714739 RepID=A0A5C6B2G2_9BACT|nr:hypothetical protein [Allorhodopirellula heiligendammensis]TWU05426.1 hypothetical protein Poly21_56660 [Allorhodopirellula heiligendammensis]